MYMRKIIVILALLALILPTLPAQAQFAAIDKTVDPLFNPNHIISDLEMTSCNAMTKDDIQNFLKSKPGKLATYKYFNPLFSMEMSAAEIIWQAAQTYQINPKVLLVLLQKEQSLVENPNATQYNFDWATGYAVCDGCSLSDPVVQKFKGFYQQVTSSAGRLRYYFDHSTESWIKKPGSIYSIDSMPVIPMSRATAFLYTYTPHFLGNYNFWRVWQRWFTLKYPDGLLVQTKDDDKIYLIQNGQILPFKSRTIFLSRYNPKNIVLVNASDLISYTQGPEIKYINFSLIKTEKNNTYLLVNDKKRLISKEAFRFFGFDPAEVDKGKEADLLAYNEGDPVSVKAKYPLGTILQNSKTGALFFAADGQKHPITDKNLIAVNFPSRQTKKATPEQLKLLKDAEPIIYQDGTLIKSITANETYLISNSQRRLIPDDATLTTLGFQRENLVLTNDETLALHPLGEPINLNPQPQAALTQAN